MKKGKRLFAGIMVVGMLATMGVSSVAGGAASAVDEIQAKGSQCKHCGENEVVSIATVESEWIVIDQILCNWEGADPWYYDDLEERQILKTFKCRNCGRGYNNVAKETKRIHNHDRW